MRGSRTRINRNRATSRDEIGSLVQGSHHSKVIAGRRIKLGHPAQCSYRRVKTRLVSTHGDAVSVYKELQHETRALPSQPLPAVLPQRKNILQRVVDEKPLVLERPKRGLFTRPFSTRLAA
jgi:hypothetical protein